MVALSIEFCFCLVQKVREFDLGSRLHGEPSVEEGLMISQRKKTGGDTGNQQKIDVPRGGGKYEMSRMKL